MHKVSQHRAGTIHDYSMILSFTCTVYSRFTSMQWNVHLLLWRWAYYSTPPPVHEVNDLLFWEWTHMSLRGWDVRQEHAEQKVTAKHTEGRSGDCTRWGSCKNSQMGSLLDRKQNILVYLTRCGFADHRTDNTCIKCQMQCSATNAWGYVHMNSLAQWKIAHTGVSHHKQYSMTYHMMITKHIVKGVRELSVTERLKK